MKKLATAILVFELIAGLLFLGLQESRGQIPTAGQAAAQAGGSGAAGEANVVVGRNVKDGQNSSDRKNSSKSVPDGENAQTEDVTDDEDATDGEDVTDDEDVTDGEDATDGEDVRKVAITFDDGPHPFYTEQLLDGLKERGVHATFFVTGAHAELHPDIIKRMQEDA